MCDRRYNPWGEGIPVDVPYVLSIDDDDETIDEEVENAREDFYKAWRSYVKDYGDSLFF